MIKQRPYSNDRWEVDIRVRLPDGTKLRDRLVAPVTGKTAALRWAQEREAWILEHRRRPSDPDPSAGAVAQEVPTLAEFKDSFIEGYSLANREKPSSIASKESVFKTHLLPVLGKKRLNEITTEDVQQLKAKLAVRKAGKEKVPVPRSPKSVNNILTVLNTTLKTAVDWKKIPEMPCRIRLLKVTHGELSFYDFSDYDRLVKGAAKVDWRALALVLLGGDAGLRMGEIIALEWTDLDFKRNTLTVQRSEWKGQVTLPKGGRNRRVPMTAALAELLKAHRALGVARVLVRDDGKTGASKKVLRIWMAAAQRRAGMKEDSKVHILRHTFCSHLAMRGATPKAIQELAGHRELSTTQRYMHLSPAHKDHAIALLNNRPTEEAAPAEVVPLPDGERGGNGEAVPQKGD